MSAISGTGPVVPPWAARAIYYVDPAGSDANTGLSPDAPRRTLSNHIAMNGATVLLKRGAVIELSTHLYPRDTYIGSYGPAQEKPRAIVPEGKTWAIGVDSGQFKISGIVLPGNAALKASTQPGIGATKASQVTVEDCEIQNYSTGIAFAGTGSVIRNNHISNMRKNGIHGGSSSHGAAPSDALISGNHINMAGSSDDGITLHDGTGFGRGNKIIGNTITGTNVENAIDLQGQFVDTLIEGNTIDGSGSHAIVIDDPVPGAIEFVGTVIRGNRIGNVNPKRAAIYTRLPNVLISENVINDGPASGGPAIAVEASARILNNTIHVPETNERSVFTIVQKAGVSAFGGEIRGNIVVNRSSQGFFALNAVSPQFMLDLWAIDQNSYSASDVRGELFLGMSFTQWRTGGDAKLRALKDVNSTLIGV